MELPPDLELLILKSIAGDLASFEQLVHRYHCRVQYFVNRLLGDLDRAEDVMQNVWLAVHRQLPALKSTRAFVAWLYQIARNQANRELRDKIRHEAQHTSLDELGEEHLSQDEPEVDADAELVHGALARLGAEQREVLTLRFMEELSYQEIAEVVGCNVGTVRSRIFYGKKALLEQIEAMKHG